MRDSYGLRGLRFCQWLTLLQMGFLASMLWAGFSLWRVTQGAANGATYA